MSDFLIEDGVLTKYEGKEAKVTIPKEARIVEEASFNGNSTIEELDFEEGVREIKNDSFSPCSSLVSLSFPESLESIGEFAFSCCRRLKSIEFPDSLSKIGRSAFSMCWSLKEVSIPESLTVLERGTFLGCRCLKNVKIKKNLERIDADVFSGCTALQNFEVDGENQHMQAKEGVLYSKDGKTLLLFPGGRLDIVIPDGVTEIGQHAFYENKNVDRLTLPEGLEKIGEGAFYQCSELLSLKLPDSLSEISGQAFEGCKGIGSMFIPDSIQSIGESTFRNCGGLKWIRLPESMEFNIHWFCAPNDSGAFSADHTVIPFITTRPISDITSELGILRAVDGFIRACIDGIEIRPEIYDGYMEYINQHVKDYYEQILKDEGALKWFCDNKLIPQDDIEELLAENTSAGAGAILLDYQNQNAPKEEKKEEPKLAQDKLDERFSALENALDF